MRVLRVSGGLDERFGGPTMSTILSCLGACEAGIDLTLVYPATRDRQPAVDALLRRLASAGAGVRSFSSGRLCAGRARRWGVNGRLAVWLLRYTRRFDLVHVHGAWTYTSLAALLAARIARRPIVLSSHETLTNFDIERSRIPTRIAKRLLRALELRAFDLVVFASELELRDSSPVAFARGVAIPHPVEVIESMPRSTQHGLRLGYLGRLDAKKNLPLLLDALASLRQETTLTIAGDGVPAIRYQLRARARELDVEPRVRWLGFVHHDEKPAFFASIDLLVLPSSYECFGVAAAEGLAAGVPVVVTTSTGLAPIVEQYGCGAVVPPERQALLRALARAEADPAVLASWRRRTREAAETELSLQQHGARLRRAYEDLVDRAAETVGALAR